MIAEITAKHLSSPTGLLGLAFGRGMNRLNFEMNLAAVDALGLDHRSEAGTQAARIAEVGFGGGVALRLLLERIGTGELTGFEPSRTMLRQAKLRYRSALRAGRLKLLEGSAGALPASAASFDALCSVNTLYFLEEPVAALRDLCRVLKPGGRMVLAYRPASDMRQLPFTEYGFRLYERRDVECLLLHAGFEAVEVDEGRDDHLAFSCARARRPMATSPVAKRSGGRASSEMNDQPIEGEL